MCPSNGGGKEFLQSLQHNVTAFPVNLANHLNVLVEEAVASYFIGDELREGRSVKVGALFQLSQFSDHVGRGNDPSKAKAGGKRLRKRAQVDYIPDGIALIAPQVLAVEDD